MRQQVLVGIIANTYSNPLEMLQVRLMKIAQKFSDRNDSLDLVIDDLRSFFERKNPTKKQAWENLIHFKKKKRPDRCKVTFAFRADMHPANSSDQTSHEKMFKFTLAQK